MKRKKLILFFFLFLLALTLITIFYCIYTNKKTTQILITYSANQYGHLRDSSAISEETFDEYGNLTHYKYIRKDDDPTEKEYYINYLFDNQNRITQVSYDNNYIQLEYNTENKISKLVNQKEYNGIIKKREYDFTYTNEIIEINSKKQESSNDSEYNDISYEKYIISEKIINNEKYANCVIYNNEFNSTEEYLYKIQNKELNYNNVFSLLNIEFEGYVCPGSDFKHLDFTIEIPIFNSENIIYFKNSTTANNLDLSYNNYYDNNYYLLKTEMSTGNNIYYMYKFTNKNEYYRYYLSTYNTYDKCTYTYIVEKIYLDNNNSIVKIETLENKELTENKYKKEVKNFEKYFNKNKQNNIY